jgi:hypothetical protein
VNIVIWGNRMAMSSKIIRVFVLVFALCGGILGAIVAIKVSHRLQWNANQQIVLVSLGAVGGFGVVWFFYWVAQNLFVEEPDDKGPS